MEARERIIQGARDQFYQLGIKSVTMDDIARSIGMSKKTIYTIFNDKEEIITSMMHTDLDNNQCIFENLSNQSKDSIQEIIHIMKHIAGMFSRINPNLFYDLQKYHPKSWKIFREFKEKCMVTMVEKNLKRGIREGLYRPNLEIKILAKLRIEEVEMGMNPGIFPPDKHNLSEVQVALLDHFLHGITTIKGHRLINKYNRITEEE